MSSNLSYTTNYVTLDMFQNLSIPQFPYLHYDYKNSMYHVMGLSELFNQNSV